MNAAIESPLTLEEVAAHFERWRKHKKKGERIPEQLWKEAVSLVESYGVSQVARTLRLGGRDLNRRRQMIQANRTAQSSGEETETAFVEVDPTVMEQAPESPAGALWMELERPDGLRLRIRPSAGMDLLGLIDCFLGAGTCCN